MALFLRQSTQVDEKIGPFLDKTDGVSEEVGLAGNGTELSKNGAAYAAGPVLGTHDAEGWYPVTLTTTHTNTVGTLKIKSHDSATHLPVWHEWQVLEEAIYDAMFAASANAFTGAAGSTQLTALADNIITAAKINTDAITAAKVASDVGPEIGTAVWATAIRSLTVLDEDSTTIDIDNSVWGGGTRTLTALDEDNTTLDLDATIRAAVGLAAANLDTQLSTIDDFLDSEIAAIKAKTDSLTFTVAGEVNANMRYRNGVAVTDVWVNHTGNAATSGAALESAITGTSDPIHVAAGNFQLTGFQGTSLHLICNPDTTLTGAADNQILNDVGGAANWTIEGYPNLSTTLQDCDAILIAAANTVVYAELGVVTVTSQENTPLAIGAGRVYIKAKELKSTAYDAIIFGGNGVAFIEADLLWAGDNGIEVAGTGTGFLSVHAKKILGQQTETLGATINLSGTNEVYIKAEYIEAGGTAMAVNQHTQTPEIAVIDCPKIRGNVEAGKVHIIGATIDSSHIAEPTLTLTGSDVILENCTLKMKASETNAITAGAARVLTVIGTLNITDETGADRSSAVHANVTIRWSLPALRPTVLNRTLDVTATGAAGIDWNNVENPTAGNAFTGTTIAWNASWDTEVQSECADAIDNDAEITAAHAAVTSGTHGNAALKTLIDAVDDFLDTEVAAIKTVTDQLTAAQSEPTGVPAANETPLQKLARVYMILNNKVTVTGSKKQFYDSGGAVEFEKDLSDDGTTYTETATNAP